MARPAIVAESGSALPEHELLARVFRVLGESSRLRMLELLLTEGEMTQTELLTRLGITQSRASDHLQCLVWCGFLGTERRGRSLVYQVVDDRAAEFVRVAREFLHSSQAGIGEALAGEGDGLSNEASA